jgi:signal transduction histidine kinase
LKLLDKNNRTFFRFSLILLVIGGGVFFLFMSWVVREEADDRLEEGLSLVIAHLKQGEAAPAYPLLLEVKELPGTSRSSEIWKDTLLMDTVQKEQEPYRQLRSFVRLDDRFFEIIVRAPAVESEDILKALALGTLILCGLLLVGLLWFNRRYSRKLWFPFYMQLDALRNYSIASHPEGIQLEKSEILEFEELRLAIRELTAKVGRDYLSLKEFTENASHEIQTPLAIIQTKLEEMSDSSLLPDQRKDLAVMEQAVNRLRQLNQGLLLLTRIENSQFNDEEELSLADILRSEAIFLKDIIESRGLKLSVSLQDPLMIKMSRSLAEVLVKNLLSNAIKYTERGGEIHLVSHGKYLEVANQGNSPISGGMRVFERFYKEKPESGTLGLGLAIARKIAFSYQLEIRYSFEKGMHHFSLSIPEKLQN